MEKYYYKKVVRNGKSITLDNYINLLSKEYKTKYITFNMKNKDDNNFILFEDSLKKQLNELNKLSMQCVKYRGSDFVEYKKKFLISDINSSLRNEGVNSTRKMVKKVINAKTREPYTNWTKSNIEMLISNMDEAMRFILKAPEFNSTNIFMLYSTLVNGIDMGRNALEEMSFYRSDQVKIGGDFGMDHTKVISAVNDLIAFVQSDYLDDSLIVKSLITHYAFEHIHPYFDFNGRMGRLINLWVLLLKDPKIFWENLHLSEAIYTYRETKYYKAFNQMNQAKDLNVDLTLWVSHLLDALIEHNKTYIIMKKLSDKSKIQLNTHAKLFLMDIITQSKILPNRWFRKIDFKRIYPDYSATIADRVMKSLEDSNLFEIRGARPKEYRLFESFRETIK